MADFAIDESIDVEGSIQEVWDCVMSHDEWRQPVVRSVRSLSEGESAVGSRFENDVRVMGVTNRIVNEITALDPPHRLGWKQVNDAPVMTREGHYVLSQSASGTTFSIRGTYSTSGWTAPPAPLARWVSRRIINRTLLPQLKRAVESGGSP